MQKEEAPNQKSDTITRKNSGQVWPSWSNVLTSSLGFAYPRSSIEDHATTTATSRKVSLLHQSHVLGLSNHETTIRSPTCAAVAHLSVRQKRHLQRLARAVIIGIAENANITPKHILPDALRQSAESLVRLAARAELPNSRCLERGRTARCVFVQAKGDGELIFGGRSLEAAARIRIRVRHLNAVKANG